MKKRNVFFSLLTMAMVVMLSLTFSSCHDDDDDEPKPIDVPVVLSLADQVKGTYSGQLKLGSEVREDAYIVTVTKFTDTTVGVKAKFLDDEGLNFNLTKQGSQIVFENATVSNLSMYYSSNTLVISYLSYGGNMLTYTGQK